MKKLPLFVNFVLFIALCASASFWALRLFKPQSRDLAAPAAIADFEPAPGQWGSLFGRSAIASAPASNYAVKGVVVARHAADSVAILIADGKPAQTIAIGGALSPGVFLQEVHESYIVILENGISKRVDLPAPASLPISVGSAGLSAGLQVIAPAPQLPQAAPNSNPAPAPVDSSGGVVVTPRPVFAPQAIISPTGIPVPPQKESR